MDIVQVKSGQRLLVHRRYLLFAFELEPSEDGRVHVDIFFAPYRRDDGSVLPVEQMRRTTVDIGSTIETGFEGKDGTEDTEGDVEITVAAHEHDLFTVHLNLPTDWGVQVEDDNDDE